MSETKQAAYTKRSSPYPGYINVTRAGDDVTVSVRADAREDGQCGPYVTLKLSGEEWRSFLFEVQNRL